MATDDASWSPAELAAAVGRSVSTRTPGLRGVLTQLRGEVCELAMPFGTAYLRQTDLAPPPRHAPGARVRTPFGRGIVTARRARAEAAAGFDYAVQLIDNRLSGWTPAEPRCAMGYLAPADVAHRPDDERTADECIVDAEALRARGNAAFKVRRRRARSCAPLRAGAPSSSAAATATTLPFPRSCRLLRRFVPPPSSPAGRGLRDGAERVRAQLRGAVELPRRPAGRRNEARFSRVLPQEHRQQRADLPEGDAARL